MDTRTSASCSSAKWVRGYSSIGIESVRVRNTTAPARSSSVFALSATASVATGSHNPVGPLATLAVALKAKTLLERAGAVVRSEEHTSELQSRGHLVCRLLLEKKKI